MCNKKETQGISAYTSHYFDTSMWHL